MNTKNEIDSFDEQFQMPNGDAVGEKLADAMIPGYQAEFDPEEAEAAGAFFEDALSEEEALESAADIALDEEEDGK